MNRRKLISLSLISLMAAVLINPAFANPSKQLTNKNSALKNQQQPFSLIADLNSMPDKPKAPAFGENAILLNGDNKIIGIGDTLKPTTNTNN